MKHSSLMAATSIAAKLQQILDHHNQAAKLTSELLASLAGVTVVASLPSSKKGQKLASTNQLKMFYGIRKAHDVPDASMAHLLKQFGFSQEADLPGSACQEYRNQLLILAEQYNPHYPVPHHNGDGSVNDDWQELEAQSLIGRTENKF